MFRSLNHVNYNFLVSVMQANFATGLKLKNSLSNQLEQFVPRQGKNVKWYTCGPTVYSNSHMGHARNYICNDMIRRVLKSHFGYNVQYCMNITDVEDKIINNSREQGVEYFEFARKWEADFFEDMGNLGVSSPDYITRVTQYMPEIIHFIQKIIANGYGYESNGSVYFNIEEFKKKFKYGKLKRIKDAETEEEETNQKNQKRNKEDFALWKAAKPGEPTWKSVWGEGRPGWHIECSAMACSILGKQMDIHSGGIDLIFPHHQNQLAQSEAFNNEPDWVKYFIHVGHLNIKGLKMSKSLKNFITIKQLVKKVSPRVIKLYFFMHRYDVVLDYDPDTSLQEAQQKDLRYKTVLGNLKVAIRNAKIGDPQKITQVDVKFDKSLETTKQKFHEAFCENINTPSVFKAIDEEIKKINIYIQNKQAKITLLEKALEILSAPFEEMGLSYNVGEEKTEGNGVDRFMDAITKFRDEIKVNAKSDYKTLLDICDRFRDEDLVDLNIRLEDKQIGQPSLWKHEQKEILIKEREKKLEAKQRKQEEKKQKQQQKINKMKVNPIEMFAKETKYTKFDENGIPTHEVDKKSETGDKPINDKLKNKLQKQWGTQKQVYEKYLNEYAPKKQQEP